jgi:hypothetical protein
MKRKLIASLIAVTALVSSSILAGVNPHIVKVDLDIEVVADASEFTPGPGGFVAKDGWKMITLSVDGAGSARLNWSSANVVVYTATNGTALANPTYWPDTSTMPSNLWVKGVDASASGPTATICGPEHICLEALNNGTPYATPYFDRVGFTVVDVDKIEYCRVDLDQSVAANWVTETNIAAGAKETPVHKAKTRITVTPPCAGVSVSATTNGVSGTVGGIVGVLIPTSSQLTDASGQVYCQYTSGDKMTNLTIMVTELAGSPVTIDRGGTLHQQWDCSDNHNFDPVDNFMDEEAFDVTFYPTLQTAGGVGAIDGHTLVFYTLQMKVVKYTYDYGNDDEDEEEISGEHPDFWYEDADVSLAYSADHFATYGPTVESSGGGVYTVSSTAHAFWDYDINTDLFSLAYVDSYAIDVYDETVWK